MPDNLKIINGELYYYDEFLDDWVPMGVRVKSVETLEEVEYEITNNCNN